MKTYDVLIVGGGLAGTALAKALAEQGVQVLVLERTKTFEDRVRGEAISPWGVAEAQALAIYEPLMQTCGHPVRWWHTLDASGPGKTRDLVETTPSHNGFLDFYHPAMQDTLLGLAEAAGTEIRRGMTVTGIAAGKPVTVSARGRDRTETLSARLVVGADGRNSQVRAWGGFTVRRDPERLRVAGVLHEGLRVQEDAAHLAVSSSIGQMGLIFPIGRQRFRSYFIHHKRGVHRQLSGIQHAPDFVRACIETGMPAEWYDGAELVGPVAEFEGADTWVEHPYRDGIVLIGDAAAASDPSFGTGLSLTLRDVRVLRDCLLQNNDWEAAAYAYAQAHEQYYSALHRVVGWITELLLEIGPEADARRARVLPRHAEEPERRLDHTGLGPETPSDEAARRRYFAED